MTWQESVLARIEAADAGSTVYDGAVPEKPAYRYAVLYADTGARESSTVGLIGADGTMRFQVTAVASSPGNKQAVEARWLAALVRDALVGWIPADAGWVCGPIEHTLSLPVRVDDSLTDRTAVIAVDQYAFLADRA